MNLLNLKTSTLFRMGAGAVALRSVLQLLLDRTGHANNVTDFALGVLLGVGIGVLLIVAWRSGRTRRGQSTDPCAR